MKNAFIIISLLWALLLPGQYVYAKNSDQVTVNGNVVDSKGDPIGFATVVVTNEGGQIVVGVSTDENGLFTFSVESGKYDVCVSIIGYKDNKLTLDASGTQITVPTVVLQDDTEMLSAASVQAVIPKTKISTEGLQTTVKGSVLEDAGNARDVLAKTPGMIQGQNGLEVIGKGSPVIYINGRKMTDSSELDRLMSSEIQNIEVINNPGAQYDAQVRAVVRIRTVKKQGEGFGFNLDLSDEQSLRTAQNDPNLNFNANYRINGVDIFAGVNAFRFSHRQVSDLTGENLLTPKFDQVSDLQSDYLQKSVYWNGGVNWQISDNHSIGFKVSYGNNFLVNDHEVMNEKVWKEGELYDDLSTVTDAANGAVRPATATANVYYNGIVGKLGIDLNLDYYGVKSSRFSHSVEKSIIEDRDVDTDSESDNKMYAGKLILSYPVWKGQLQAGTEDVFLTRTDEYSLTGAPIPSSNSEVKETNLAGFVNYAIAFPKVGQFNAGVRYENVKYRYESFAVGGGENIDRDYSRFFPTFSYAGAIGKVQTMLSYSVKTVRPSFDNLSSAIRYNNKYTLQSGNASLQPSYINMLSATAVWKFFTFMVNYNKITDEVSVWSERYIDAEGKVSEGVVMISPKNLDEPVRTLSAMVNVTPTVGIWTLNATAGVQAQWLTIHYKDKIDPTLNRDLKFNDMPLVFVQMFNTFRVKNGWQFELGGEYHSKSKSENMYITNNYLNVTAAVQKTLLKDGSLVLRLSGSDLAGLGFNNVYADFGAHIITQTNLMDVQRLKFTVRYKFNTASNKYKGSGAGSDVKSRMN